MRNDKCEMRNLKYQMRKQKCETRNDKVWKSEVKNVN